MKTSDLCDKYGQQITIAEPIGFISYGRRKEFFGQIETVKCFEDNSLVRTAIEKSGKGKILVVDGGRSRRCALLGDMLAALALNNEWNGILIHGSIRDSDEIANLDIGVLALGTHPKKSAKNNEGAAQVTVHFSGVDFVPGQFIYIDVDGIVISKSELALDKMDQ